MLAASVKKRLARAAIARFLFNGSSVSLKERRQADAKQPASPFSSPKAAPLYTSSLDFRQMRSTRGEGGRGTPGAGLLPAAETSTLDGGRFHS